MDDTDFRVLRDRQRAIDDQIDRLAAIRPPDAGRGLLCQTTTVSSYPTTGGVYYAVLQVEAAGTEAEGATPTFSAGTGNVFYAINLGTAIPPSGTYVICRYSGGRWAFRYDG